MDFGIALATTLDSWKVVRQAEQMGFTHAWFYDTQLLNPDVFIGMALAARETSRIRLGTGVLVPSNRLSAVTANCLASLNKLAPGRIDFGVGTGFTARRTMGQPGVKLAALTRYVNEVMGLLRGETVECLVDGEARKLRFLNPDVGMINIDDPVRLHMSALGPNARKATARLDAGWINFDGNNGRAIGALTDMQMSWANSGRIRDALYTSLFVLGCVLRPGERMTSPRVLAQAGPYAAVMLHNLIETSAAGDFEGYFPKEINDSLEGLRKVYEQYEPADARYLSLHRGHLMFLRPDERRFINKAMIETFTYTAKPAQLTERVEALADAGYSQFTVQLVNGQEDALAEWAEVLKPLGLKAPGGKALVGKATVRRKTAAKSTGATKARK